jgi:hypothetical protein
MDGMILFNDPEHEILPLFAGMAAKSFHKSRVMKLTKQFDSKYVPNEKCGPT